MDNLFVPEQVNYIIYADDDPDDRDLLQDAMFQVNPQIGVIGAISGLAAMAYLDSLGPGQLLPSAVVLDQNMPGWTGLQTLDFIKASADYQMIPAFILTTSDNPKLRNQALEMGAVFLTKPYLHKDLLEVCATISQNSADPAGYKQ